jgi:hypothetical protein
LHSQTLTFIIDRFAAWEAAGQGRRAIGGADRLCRAFPNTEIPIRLRRQETPVQKQGKSRRALVGGMFAAALIVLSLAGSASAQLTGNFTAFQQCPWTNAEVSRCLYSVAEGGEFSVGQRKVPIVNPIVLQGGIAKSAGEFASIVAANNGVTLAPVSEPIPGGLFGIVPPEKSPPAIKGLVKALIASRLNRVDATMELAGAASNIQLSLANLTSGEGVGIRLPVKVRLENPLLGKACYVGSDSVPVMLGLTTGTTAPPPPNLPISGEPGSFEFLNEARILRLNGNTLVDNAWSAPKATGCGGALHSLVEPIVNAQLGLPSAAGRNSATLTSTLMIAAPAAVRGNDEETP